MTSTQRLARWRSYTSRTMFYRGRECAALIGLAIQTAFLGCVYVAVGLAILLWEGLRKAFRGDKS